jgi:hypothetical protein
MRYGSGGKSSFCFSGPADSKQFDMITHMPEHHPLKQNKLLNVMT